MKLNSDCLRAILLSVESLDYNQCLTLSSLSELLPEYSWECLNYHCLKLCESGYLTAQLTPERGNVLPVVSRIQDLTFSGHQFLENIRSDTIWSDVKEVSGKIGSHSVSAISQIATAVITALINRHFGLT